MPSSSYKHTDPPPPTLPPPENMLMSENICNAFINMQCAMVLCPVAGLLLPCKKVHQSREKKEEKKKGAKPP